MPLELWLAYAATSAVVLAIPGPTILLVLSYAIAHGRPAALPLITGVALGDAVAITLSLLGLGTLLAASAFWFTGIKWLGGLYLLYLGVRLLGDAYRPRALQAAADAPRATPGKLFASAFVVTALNPKSIVFFIALLPQFISRDFALLPQLVILGATFVTLAIAGATGYALFAASIRRFLSTPRAQRAYGLAGGGLLCGAGVWALSAKRVISAS